MARRYTRRRSYRSYRRRSTSRSSRSRYRNMPPAVLEKCGADVLVGTTVSPVGVTTNLVTNNGTYLLNGLTMGNASWNRLGRKISMSKIQIQGTYSAGFSDTTPNTRRLRIAVVYDSSPDGTLPSFQDVWSYTLADGTTGTDVTCPTDYGNQTRFSILYQKDVNIACQYNAANGGSTPQIQGSKIKIFKTFAGRGGKSVFNNGNAGDIGDFTRGALYLMVYGETGCEFNCVSRLRYYA